jgi:formylglycine-generating enzyme required for sulfatase activity
MRRISTSPKGLLLALAVGLLISGCRSAKDGGGAAGQQQEEATKSLGVGKTLTLDLRNSMTMKLVLIPAGKFLMGSPIREEGRGNDEGQHEVTISKPFYMGVYDVTQEQYEQVMGQNPSHFKGAKNPVEMVSWDEAVEFCKKLSAKTGKTVQLPTEAQWEYACRAGSKTRFCFGNDDMDMGLDEYGWYAGNSSNVTHPVGQKKPNAFGLYDMHGNVFQWCSDWYGAYPAGGVTDPTGPADGQARVFRGGSWSSNQQGCRSAFRGDNSPDTRLIIYGFRVVAAGSGLD